MASKFKPFEGCTPLIPLSGLLLKLPPDELSEWEVSKQQFAIDQGIDFCELSPTMVEFSEDGNVFLYCTAPNGDLALTCIHRLKFMYGLVHTLAGSRPHPTMN